jgi:hypothetical protein
MKDEEVVKTNARNWICQLLSERWILKLRGELCHRLDSLAVSITIPPLEIVDVESFWGKWDPLAQKISLSLSLFLDHHFEDVIGIALHEVAHAMVSLQKDGGGKFPERSDGNDSGLDHGEEFQAACERLHLEPKYRKSHLKLENDSDLWPRETAPLKSFQRRLSRLLALSKSTSPHEAELALQRAQELMETWGREDGNQQMWGQLESEILETGKKRLTFYESRLGYLFQKHQNVTVVTKKLYCPKEDAELMVLDVLGGKPQVQMCVYLWDFILKRMKSCWIHQLRHAGFDSNQRNSYYLGFLDGVDRAMTHSPLVKDEPLCPISPRGKEALITQDYSSKLKAFVKQKYPRLSTRSRSRVRLSRNSYESGKKAGTQTNVKRPLESSEGGQRLIGS